MSGLLGEIPEWMRRGIPKVIPEDTNTRNVRMIISVSLLIVIVFIFYLYSKTNHKKHAEMMMHHHDNPDIIPNIQCRSETMLKPSTSPSGPVQKIDNKKIIKTSNLSNYSDKSQECIVIENLAKDTWR